MNEYAAGSTSVIELIFLQDSTSTTGAGKTGLTNATSGLTCQYKRTNGIGSVSVPLNSITTLGTYNGDATHGALKEIDNALMPGWYEFHLPNNALTSGAKEVAFHFRGAAGLADRPIKWRITGVDLDLGTPNAGITALPPVALTAPFYLPPGSPPLRVLSDTFSAATNGLFNDMDGRMLETGQVWQQGGDIFVKDGRCVSNAGADGWAGADSYTADNFTLTSIINGKGDTTGTIAIGFRFSTGQLLSGSGWVCVIDFAASLMRLGTLTNGVWAEVKNTPLKPASFFVAFDNTVEHLLTIRCNGTRITAILDANVQDQGQGICAITTTSSTYQTQTYCGMISNALGLGEGGAGKYFADIHVDTPTPDVPAGNITNATLSTPLQITSAGHGLQTGNVVNVFNVGGKTGANRERWTITRVDANNFTLNGSNDGNAYTSGGIWFLVLSPPPYPWPVGFTPTTPAAERIAHVLLSDTDAADLGQAGSLGYTVNNAPAWVSQQFVISLTSNLIGSTLYLMKDTDMLDIDALAIKLSPPPGVDISAGTFALSFDEGKLTIVGSYDAGNNKARFEPTASQTKLLKAGIMHNWAATVTLSSPTRTIPLVPGYGVAQVVSRQDGT